MQCLKQCDIYIFVHTNNLAQRCFVYNTEIKHAYIQDMLNKITNLCGVLKFNKPHTLSVRQQP